MTVDLVTLIGQLGFPIAVSAYLLVMGTKVIGNMTTAINNQTQAIEQLSDYIKGGGIAK